MAVVVKQTQQEKMLNKGLWSPVMPWAVLYLVSLLFAGILGGVLFTSRTYPADEAAVVLAIPIIVLLGVPNLVRALLGIKTPIFDHQRIKKLTEAPWRDGKFLLFVVSLVMLIVGAALGVSSVAYSLLELTWAKGAVLPISWVLLVVGTIFLCIAVLWIWSAFYLSSSTGVFRSMEMQRMHWESLSSNISLREEIKTRVATEIRELNDAA